SANYCIMAYMHLVIHFSAFANNRISGYAPVDGTASAYFNSVFYNHATAAGHFFILYSAVGFSIVIKSITSNNSAALYYHIITYNAMIKDRYIGKDGTVLSNNHIIAKIGIRHYYRAFTYNR